MQYKVLFSAASAALLMAGCGMSTSSQPHIESVSGLKVSSVSRHYMTDKSGRTLYTFSKDTANTSHCEGKCKVIWPAFKADTTTKEITSISAEYSAYLGHPLYYFIKDKKPFDALGEGVKGVWHLIYTSKPFEGGVATSPTKKEMNYLSDQAGRALYTFDKDGSDVSNCYGECEKKWPVFYANPYALKLPSGMNASDFNVIKRKDGTMQTTYKSQPLYYFFKDTQPHDVKGDWVKGVWHLIPVYGK